MAGPLSRRLSGLLRRVRGTHAATALLARLAAGYVWLLRKTVRWRVEGLEHLDALLAEGGGFVASIWHGRLLMSPTWAPPGRIAYAMISQNRDGELIAGIVGRFGVRTIRGSSYDRAKGRDKGGTGALRAACDVLRRERAVVAITPDGPRGPRMHAQPGIARIAIETGAAVLPVAFSARTAWTSRGWDRFLVPLPFSRGAAIYGAPLRPPPPGDPEAEARFLAEIEAATTTVTERADRICGRATPAPAAPHRETARGEGA